MVMADWNNWNYYAEIIIIIFIIAFHFYMCSYQIFDIGFAENSRGYNDKRILKKNINSLNLKNR